MFQLNDGRVVDASTSIEYPKGILRPPGWIASLSASEKKELGITDWTPPAYVPPIKTLDEQKKEAIANVKRQAGNALAPSDWMVVRKVEAGTPIPAEWETYRTDVRATANAVETDINSALDEDDIAYAVNVEWPRDPNAPPLPDEIIEKRPDVPKVG